MVDDMHDIIRKCLQNGELLDIGVAEEWSSQATESDLELLGWVCLEHSSLLSAQVARELYGALIRVASDLLREGSEEFTRYELLKYLGGLFMIIWGDREFRLQSESIVKQFATLVRGWPARGDDAVITAVLEHIFCDDRIRRHFFSWSRDPELREAYYEAIRLSDGFRKLGERD